MSEVETVKKEEAIELLIDVATLSELKIILSRLRESWKDDYSAKLREVCRSNDSIAQKIDSVPFNPFWSNSKTLRYFLSIITEDFFMFLKLFFSFFFCIY